MVCLVDVPRQTDRIEHSLERKVYYEQWKEHGANGLYDPCFSILLLLKWKCYGLRAIACAGIDVTDLPVIVKSVGDVETTTKRYANTNGKQQ